MSWGISDNSWKTIAIPCSRAVLGRSNVYDLAVDPDLALLGSNDPGHDFHERAFAGSVLTEERMDLRLLDREFRLLEGVDPAVLLGDTVRRERFVL